MLQERTESIEPDWLSAGERFTVLRADLFAPIGGIGFELFEYRGTLRRTPGYELALIASDCGLFLLPLCADIQDERGLQRQAEVDAVIVIDPLGVVWLARHIRIGQFGPKPSGFDQLGGGNMIWMSVDPVGSEQPLRLKLANDRRHLLACFEGGLQAAIRQSQVFAPIEPQ